MGKDVGNSFYRQNYRQLKVLVIVPHQDDEINTAGALLYNLSHCGAKITLVYTTNGDLRYPARTRIKEAVNSASVLGISKENLFFFGYGDSINNEKKDHVFYNENESAISAAGHTETYGTDEFPDYAYIRNGEHHSYTNTNYLSDLVAIIRQVKAELIICTDFDEHPDHRMLALYFDKAMRAVRETEPDYCPEVWKRFAYALAYTAVSDFTVFNNSETKRPAVGITEKYEWDIVGTSIYTWDNRIRIPVSNAGAAVWRDDPIANALRQHKSQYIITHADRIINSDEVYWRRRTDSISYEAEITTSSGNGSCLNDFMLYNISEIDSTAPKFTNYCWRPDNDDNEKKATLIWKEPQHIEQIVLYGSMEQNSKIKELKITLSDGYTAAIKDIPANGNPVSIDVGKHAAITTCEIRIISAEGNAYGLSECEVYGSLNVNSHIRPFCKILVDDNFVYEYICDEMIEKITLGLYCFGTSHPGEIEVIKGESKIVNRELFLDSRDKEIVLRIENKDLMIWDQVVIKRLSLRELKIVKKKDAAVKAYLRRKRRELKIHNMFYILRYQGIRAVIKRAFANVIRPCVKRMCYGKK